MSSWVEEKEIEDMSVSELVTSIAELVAASNGVMLHSAVKRRVRARHKALCEALDEEVKVLFYG